MLSREEYMRLALAEARQAAEQGEVPIGAIIVARESGRILGRGHNLTEALGDVTAHAEMMAITAAQTALGGKYLKGCTLFVTVEPCPMCAGAIGWSQLDEIVIGTPDPKRGYRSICVQDKSPFHPRAKVEWGVLEDDCRKLMQDFFKARR